MQRASISSRFSAMNLDMIIFVVIWQSLSMLSERVAPGLATPLSSVILSFLTVILYFVYPTKASGQTLGKKLLSVKVVPSAGDKLPLTWGQVFLREIVGKTLGTIPLYLGYIWAYTNSDHRAWHDSMSHTHVISLIWEDEKTPLQKLQHIMLGILSIPLGVALILGIFFYTSLPLDSIKEKIEASGIQVGALTGSLAGGLHFSQISRQDKGQAFSLSTVDVKFNLAALAIDRIFIIEKLTAEEGHIEVPEGFSWATIFLNLMALGQIQNQETSLGNFRMGKLQIKNIFFEHNKKAIMQLQEFTLKNLEIADKELRINEAQFQISGLSIKVEDFKSAFGRIEVASATGGVGPDFLPILKVPVDFHIKGSIGKNLKTTRLDGGMMIDKIKFSVENEKLTVNVDKLLLNEMFKTALPLEELDLKLSSQGENALEMMSSLNVEYGIKVCGNEFRPDAERGSIYTRGDHEFTFRVIPKPVPDFGKMAFNKEATLDDLLLYELHGQKQTLADFSSPREMLADLCYQKALANLLPEELEHLRPLEMATATVSASSTPPAFVSAELARRGASEARNLLRLGKYNEVIALLEAVPISSETFPVAERGIFYSLKAWAYLYTNQLAEAAQTFELAFNARKDISDAEGLLRAYEAMKKDEEAQRWLGYIKVAIKANPALKTHLTPNMQKKLTSSGLAAE